MEKPVMVLQKKVENNTNKIRIPKIIVDQWGSKFYMEIYEEKIVLKPIRRCK